MRKTVTAVAALAMIGGASVMAPSTAAAGGGCCGAAVVTGFAAGAMLPGPYPYQWYGYGYYAPPPVYADYPGPTYFYYAPRPFSGCSRWGYGYRYRAC
jgi:hypothetical protein